MRAPSLAAITLFLLSACQPASDGTEPATVQPDVPAASLMTWSDLLGRERPTASHNIQTGPNDTDRVDLWIPEGPGPHPVIIMVHGGCWQKSIADRTLMDFAAEHLRQNGLAVWNIEYRGVDEDGGGYPGTFLDVARNADALRDHADRYNLKLDRIGAFGHSAGGHLALWLAARPKISPSSPLWKSNPIHLDIVVNAGGLADLEVSSDVTQESCLASILPALTGAPTGQRPDVFSDTSPSELLPFAAHQISLNGAQDRIAPPLLGQDYTSKAKSAGSDARFVLVPDTGHVELIAPGTEAFERASQILTNALTD